MLTRTCSDALDEDDVWNIARIVQVTATTVRLFFLLYISLQITNMCNMQVTVHYDGWQAKNNDVIQLSANRLAPVTTFTTMHKCWAKMGKYPFWPAIVCLPAPANATGCANLRDQERVLINYLDAEKDQDQYVKHSRYVHTCSLC